MISRFMVRHGFSAGVAAIAVLCLAAIVSGGAQSPPEAALKSLQAARILADIKTLSSDAFEGRGPGTHGEELSVAFMEKEFRAIGLAPGNPDGSYLQKVPLVGIKPDPSMKLTISGHDTTLHPEFEKDYVAWSKRVVESTKLDNAEMVFVGYGVQAPEYKWDDFKGMDVRGKVIVVLINDPPVADEKCSAARP